MICKLEFLNILNMLCLLNGKIANRYKYLLINKYHNKKLDETIESKELKKLLLYLTLIIFKNNFTEYLKILIYKSFLLMTILFSRKYLSLSKHLHLLNLNTM